MMRNSSMNTKSSKLTSPWSLYTSIWRPTPWWETVLWTQRTINENRPGACIQAYGAQHHDEKQFYEHKERYTIIALELVYKHLVPKTMMRNSFMNTKNCQRLSPWSLYTSMRLPTPWRETVLWTQRMVNDNRPGACIQAFGAQHHDEKQFYEHK